VYVSCRCFCLSLLSAESCAKNIGSYNFLTEEIMVVQNFILCPKVFSKIGDFRHKCCIFGQNFFDNEKIFRQFSDSRKFRVGTLSNYVPVCCFWSLLNGWINIQFSGGCSDWRGADRGVTDITEWSWDAVDKSLVSGAFIQWSCVHQRRLLATSS